MICTIYKTVRKNIYYRRIDEPAPGVTPHIISESKITFSALSASQLLPHLSPQLVQGVRQNICSIYELDLIDCNLQSMSYYLPDSLYFDILFYSPENLKYILSFYTF